MCVCVCLVMFSVAVCGSESESGRGHRFSKSPLERETMLEQRKEAIMDQARKSVK